MSERDDKEYSVVQLVGMELRQIRKPGCKIKQKNLQTGTAGLGPWNWILDLGTGF